MTITVRRTTSAELRERLGSLNSKIPAQYTNQDLEDLARMGVLDDEVLKVVEEISRVRFLLGER